MRFFSPRRVLALAVMAIGLMAAPSAQASTYQPIRGTQLFAPDSVWNKPLAADAPLTSNSSTLSGTLNWERSYFGPWINTTSYSTPIYTVAADQATLHVTLDNNNAQLAADFNQVPLPPDARPAAGTDGHLVVWQPSTQTMWEFWQLHKDSSGNWHTTYGGKMSNVSSNPGYYANRYGATATSLPVAAGVITLQEETDGVINHALALAIPHPKAGTFVYPAQRGDGDSTSDTAIPEGTRFRLPASLNIDALNLPRQTAMMAKAAQKYGIIVVDGAGAVTFRAEDPYLFTQQFGIDPYGPYAFGGQSPGKLLGAFPWQQLQVVQP
jgi:hypothetical protein